VPLAAVLRQEPQLVAAAVHAFFHRQAHSVLHGTIFMI
jgi:hypothetical protein